MISRRMTLCLLSKLVLVLRVLRVFIPQLLDWQDLTRDSIGAMFKNGSPRLLHGKFTTSYDNPLPTHNVYTNRLLCCLNRKNWVCKCWSSPTKLNWLKGTGTKACDSLHPFISWAGIERDNSSFFFCLKTEFQEKCFEIPDFVRSYEKRNGRRWNSVS